MAAGVAAVGLTLAACCIALRPDQIFDASFVVHDVANELYIGKALAGGAMLYRDVAFPYGLIPGYILGAIGATVGISAQAIVWAAVLAGAIFTALLTLALQRHVARPVAAAVVLLGVLPVSLTPGAVLGGYFDRSYVGLERLIIVLLIIAWRPPERRSRRRAAALGGLLGAWQHVKFGGAVFFGLALAGADVLAVWCSGGRWRDLPRRWLPTILAGVAVEGTRWALLFLMEPRPVALDAAWPLFTVQLYRQLPAGVLWPLVSTPVELLTQWAIPGAALALSAWTLAGIIRSSGSERVDDLALVLPALFFLAGFLGYYGHAHTVRQYAWCLVPGAAPALARAGRVLRTGAFAVALPAALMVLKIIFLNPSVGDVRPIRFATGDTLWLTTAQARTVDSLIARIRSRPDRAYPGVMAMPVEGGLYYFAGRTLPTRHAWVVSSYTRPYEIAATERWLDQTDTILVVDEPVLDRGRASDVLDGVFGPDLGRRLAVRIRQVEGVARNWWLVELRSPDGRTP